VCVQKGTQHQPIQTEGLLTDETRHHTANCGRDTEQMSDSRSIQEFVLEDASALPSRRPGYDHLTGTFFWIMTTTVSLPRTEMEVCPEPEIALNAYSETVSDHADLVEGRRRYVPTWYRRPSGENTVRYLYDD
jgi:hypothetical protein